MAETTPIQTIKLHGVAVWIKREDQNHPIIQGNKLRKLKYNLIDAQTENAKTLITFGGAYSNHLAATAYAAKQVGLTSIGVVRGDELAQHPEKWSTTLQHCQQYGMRLVFVSRRDFRLKQHSQVVQQLLVGIEAPFIIPEGGSNSAAIKGVAELVTEIGSQLPAPPSHVFCPVGTGGTIAGLIVGCAQNQWHCKVIGISVLKGLHGVKNDINQWLGSQPNDIKLPEWHICQQFHGGGYAKLTSEMEQFGRQFNQDHGIALDKIYNGKSFYALENQIQHGAVKSGDRPLIIHTGGLQGGVL